MKEYLQAAHTLENLVFWYEIGYFKSHFLKRTPASRLDDAKRVHRTFILVNSAFEVNIPYAARKEISEAIESGVVSLTMFDEARREVAKLLYRGIITKWRREVQNRVRDIVTKLKAEENWERLRETFDELLRINLQSNRVTDQSKYEELFSILIDSIGYILSHFVTTSHMLIAFSEDNDCNTDLLEAAAVALPEAVAAVLKEKPTDEHLRCFKGLVEICIFLISQNPTYFNASVSEVKHLSTDDLEDSYSDTNQSGGPGGELPLVGAFGQLLDDKQPLVGEFGQPLDDEQPAGGGLREVPGVDTPKKTSKFANFKSCCSIS